MSGRINKQAFALDARSQVTSKGDFILYLTNKKITVGKVREVRIKKGNWAVLTNRWIDKFYKLSTEA